MSESVFVRAPSSRDFFQILSAAIRDHRLRGRAARNYVVLLRQRLRPLFHRPPTGAFIAAADPTFLNLRRCTRGSGADIGREAYLQSFP